MKFGYQLYSALPLCKDKAGLVDTLEKIAAMGYDGVEFCDYAGIPAAEMKVLLARLHLEGFNTHVNMGRWLKDPEGEIRYAAEAGIPCVTIDTHYPEIQAELKRRRIASCEARGEVWIDDEERERLEREENERQAEIDRVADLKAKCAKKGLDFDTENQKYLDKKAAKDAKLAAKQTKKDAKKAKKVRSK